MTNMDEKRVRAVVALGMFDGVHIGHQRLLSETAALAGRLHAAAVACTFENHPLSVLGGRPRLLTDAAQRRELLLAAGMDQVRMERFDAALAHSTPERFVEHLASLWTLAGVVVGYNYTFGERACGTPETLRALGAQRGFAVAVLPPVSVGDEPVSSTRIRLLLEREGDVRRAAALLGRSYRLSGRVIPNRQNGRRFGFPTANIAAAQDAVLPLSGVYATRALAGGRWRPAVTNVGTNPTVHGDHVTVETHVLDFAGDLYGEALSVDFIERLRGERRFDSEQELVARIARDAARARELLGG